MMTYGFILLKSKTNSCPTVKHSWQHPRFPLYKFLNSVPVIAATMVCWQQESAGTFTNARWKVTVLRHARWQAHTKNINSWRTVPLFLRSYNERIIIGVSVHIRKTAVLFIIVSTQYFTYFLVNWNIKQIGSTPMFLFLLCFSKSPT
jgi:hypothetical protein